MKQLFWAIFVVMNLVLGSLYIVSKIDEDGETLL